MMTDTTEEAIRRADRAATMISDPLFSEAFDEIRGALTDMWQTAPMRDTEGRERIFMQLRLLDNLRAVFVGHIEGGKVARDNLARAEKARHLARPFSI